MSPAKPIVEILDATDPDITKRIVRMAVAGRLGIRSPRFWYFSGEMAVIATLTFLWALELFAVLNSSWWLALAFGLPAGIVLHCSAVWARLKLQIGIRTGDQWYILDTNKGRGAALVKKRRGTTYVARLEADSIDLADQLSDFLIVRGVGDAHSHFVTPPRPLLKR